MARKPDPNKANTTMNAEQIEAVRKDDPYQVREDAAVQRLRESKEQWEQRVREAGFAAGQDHALGSADYEELRRLERLSDGLTQGAMHREEDLQPEEVFPDGAPFRYEDEVVDPEWLEAFLEGCVKTFHELHRRL
jgi:hypothetical protein